MQNVLVLIERRSYPGCPMDVSTLQTMPLHHYYTWNFKVFDKEVTVNECTCIKYRNYTMSITTVIMQSNKCSYSLCPEQNRQKIVKVHIKMNFINCFIKLYRPVVFNTKQNMTRAKKKIKNNAPSSVISNDLTRLQLFI